MLNLQHYYIIVFYPALLALVSTTLVLLINYLYYVKNLLFSKLKTKKKMVNGSGMSTLGSYSMNTLTLVIICVYFNLKYSTDQNLYFKNFTFYKYSFSVFIILGFLAIFINLLFKYYYNLNYTLNYNSYIGGIFSILLFLTLHSKNFLTLFIFIELFGYLFYLQFLQVFNKLKTKKITNFYLDNLLLYYWLNFFGSIILLYAIILLFLILNTVDILEVNYFCSYKSLLVIILFFLLAFSLKIGIPGLHSLKIEIYKNLKLDSIINFSFFSIFGYLIILKFIFINFSLLINLSFLFPILIIFLIFFFIPVNLRVPNVVLFFGYSTILNAALCLFIVI